MAWDKGFNFRESDSYVTDGANQTYVRYFDAYPTTRNGVTFGWVSAPSDEDQNASGDVRLAGINYSQNNGEVLTFQVDLPAAGSYIITLANGHFSSNVANNKVEFLDNTTSLATVSTVLIVADNYVDASGVSRSEANWPSQNVSITKTFSSTTFNMKIGNSVLGGYTCVNHLFLSQAASDTQEWRGSYPPFRNRHNVNIMY